jgi:hypothetical protein
MTSSRTGTLIYIAELFRVNIGNLLFSFLVELILFIEPDQVLKSYSDAFTGSVQEYFNLFFRYVDRPRPEYETLLILQVFRDSYDFITNATFSRSSGKSLWEKL